MMTRMLFALSLGLVGLMFGTETRAQSAAPQSAAPQTGPQCGARPQVLQVLADKYGETRRGIGIAANNTVMEVFASAESGTWTITVTLPDGKTCLMASGQGFETMADELPAKGDPA